MDKQLIDLLNNYLARDKVDGAFYIDGEWGTGKSFFINRFMDNYAMSYYKKNQVSEYKWVYISLNGLRTVDEISKEIYSACHPKIAKFVNNKITKGVLSLIKIAGNIGGVENDSIDGLGQSIQNSASADFSSIVFDDFERCRIDCQELLGFINALVNESNIKVILIGNDVEVRKYLQKDDFNATKLLASNISTTVDDYFENYKKLKEPLFYDVIKEKTIYKTYYFVLDKSIIFDELTKDYSLDFQRRVKRNKDLIESILSIKKCNNLRTCKVAFENYHFITKNIHRKFNNDQSIKNQILLLTLFYTVSFKSGENEMPIVNELYLKNSFTLYSINSIWDYVKTGCWNREKVINEIEIIDNEISILISKNAPDSLKKLNKSWYFKTDDELKNDISNLIDDIKVVPFNCYFLCIKYLITYKRWFNDTKINLDEIYSIMKAKIDEELKEIDYNEDYLLFDITDDCKETIDDFHNYFEVHNKNVSKSEFLNIEDNLEKYSIEDLNKIEQDAYRYRCFFSRINVDKLMLIIEEGGSKAIFQIRRFLQNVYRVSNINAFFKTDIDNLKLFLSELENFKTDSTIVYKSIELLKNEVEQYISKLEQ